MHFGLSETLTLTGRGHLLARRIEVEHGAANVQGDLLAKVALTNLDVSCGSLLLLCDGLTTPTLENGNRDLNAVRVGVQKVAGEPGLSVVAEHPNLRQSRGTRNGNLLLCRLELRARRLEVRTAAHRQIDGAPFGAGNLITGGLTTTSQLLGNLLHQLLTDPDLERSLRADDSAIANAVEESLRFAPPLLFVARGCVRDTSIANCPVEAGERVVVGTGSANRDERVFEDGDEFRVDRPNADQHLTFGYGAHVCPGAALARVVARIGIATFLDRFPPGSVRFASDFEFENVPTFFEIGPRHLPVDTGVARGSGMAVRRHDPGIAEGRGRETHDAERHVGGAAKRALNRGPAVAFLVIGRSRQFVRGHDVAVRGPRIQARTPLLERGAARAGADAPQLRRGQQRTA